MSPQCTSSFCHLLVSSSHAVVVSSIQPSPSCGFCRCDLQSAEGRFCVPVVPVWAIWWRSLTLSDPVVLISVAASLKWLMIINPTGGEIRLICTYPRHHMHKYQSVNESLSSRVSGDLRFICSVSVMWTPWTCADGWLTGMQTSRGACQGQRFAVGGGCVRTEREHLSSVFASDGSR